MAPEDESLKMTFLCLDAPFLTGSRYAAGQNHATTSGNARQRTRGSSRDEGSWTFGSSGWWTACLR